MYVFTENAFLQIVAHDQNEELLEVRGQFEGDIERTFPEAEVACNLGQEYPYSTAMGRDRVAERIALRVRHIGYRHFNPSSEEPWRQSVIGQIDSALKSGREK